MNEFSILGTKIEDNKQEKIVTIKYINIIYNIY
jgi:hypothetical protein